MTPFGKIRSKLWTSSRKWRLLRDEPETRDDARLLYLYLHTSPHRQIGTYVLPVAYISEDLSWEIGRVHAGLDRLVEVGLILYDSAEQVVHLVAWVREDGPTNARHWLGLKNHADHLPAGPCKQACLTELSQSQHRTGTASPAEAGGTIDLFLDEDEPEAGDSTAAQGDAEPEKAYSATFQAAERCLKTWTDIAPLKGFAARPTAIARSLDTLDKLMRLDHVSEEDTNTICRHAAESWVPRGMIGSPASLREDTQAGDRKKWEALLAQATGKPQDQQQTPPRRNAPRNREAYM